MRNLSLLLLGLVLACGDDDGLTDASDASSSSDAAIDGSATDSGSPADAGSQPDTGVAVDPAVLWTRFTDVLAAACSCATAPEVLGYCMVDALSEREIACLADVVSGPEAQPNLQCSSRRLNDLESCMMGATCGDSDSDSCLQSFENRLEGCPQLSESIQDALSACEEP